MSKAEKVETPKDVKDSKSDENQKKIEKPKLMMMVTKDSTLDGESKSVDDVKPKPRCFNCGKIGHESRDCLDRWKGPKCFVCGEFGHKAKDCQSKVEDVEEDDVNDRRKFKDGVILQAFEHREWKSDDAKIEHEEEKDVEVPKPAMLEEPQDEELDVISDEELLKLIKLYRSKGDSLKITIEVPSLAENEPYANHQFGCEVFRVK